MTPRAKAIGRGVAGGLLLGVVVIAIWRAPRGDDSAKARATKQQQTPAASGAASAPGSAASAPSASSASSASSVASSRAGVSRDGYVARSARVMATRIDVLVPRSAGGWAPALVFDIFRRVDKRMSEWKASSPLSAVNAAAGVRAVRVPADLRAVVRRGLAFGRASAGAFDVSWAALWGLWRFTGDKTKLRVPSAEAIAARVALVDYRKVVVDDSAGTVYLPRRGMKLGLGGIAKGYALAAAVAALRKRGLRSFLLSGGGQTYAAGTRGARPWRVGVRDPRGGPSDFFARFELRDASAATSGDYERFFVRGDVRYHHILDPRTGRPARGLRSVTVVDTDPTRADALSTAIFVMGRERGLALARRTAGLEAFVVDARGHVHRTAGFRAQVLRAPRPR